MAKVEEVRRAKTRGGGPKNWDRVDLLGGLLECVCGRRLRNDGTFADGRHRRARNVRATGEADLRTRRCLKHVRVVEHHGAERDAVVNTHASTITCHCQRCMKQLPDPADHPVVRIGPTAT